MSESLLAFALSPYLELIERWALAGTLADMFDEFFIVKQNVAEHFASLRRERIGEFGGEGERGREREGEVDWWTDAYVIQRDRLPAFISLSFAEEVSLDSAVIYLLMISLISSWFQFFFLLSFFLVLTCVLLTDSSGWQINTFSSDMRRR